MIIILATAVIVTILDNNPIASAIRAIDDSNVAKYTEQIEQVRSKLLLQNENHELPNLLQMKEALEKEKWVLETEMIMDEGIEKLKIVSKEGYIFYITEEEVEYKGKGEVVDTSALKRDDVLELVAEEETAKGQYVKITSKAEEYYVIKYKIGEEENNWTEIKSGERVEVPYGKTIYAKLFYGSSFGVEFKLKIGETNPSIVAKDTDTSNMKRKTDIAFANLFDITWGSEGIGKTKYEVSGNLLFENNSYNNENITNIKDLEFGTYDIKCTITSPNGNYTTNATKEIKVTKFAVSSVENSLGNNVYANGIYSEYDLAQFREIANSSSAITNGKVLENINLSTVSAKGWTPIGNSSYNYNGIFDGNKKIIDNLYINATSDNQGLFGIAKNATISNAIIGRNSNITANSQVGAIVGNATNCNISKCGNNATVTAESIVGGIIGINVNTRVTQSYNKADIKGGVDTKCIGGICGFVKEYTAPVTIDYSYNTGDITGGYYIGGIVGAGNDYSKINNCYNKGLITGKNYIPGDVDSFIGGIVGRFRAYGEANYCYNLGNVVNTSSGRRTAGIAGEIVANSYHSSKVENCYNSGNVQATGIVAGGITNNDHYCYVRNSYSLSSAIISCGDTTANSNIGGSPKYVGKVLGHNNSGSANISNIDVLSSLPTVYNVVNSLSNGESDYWSLSNVNAPLLKWE